LLQRPENFNIYVSGRSHNATLLNILSSEGKTKYEFKSYDLYKSVMCV
jgi:hypothetical protein